MDHYEPLSKEMDHAAEDIDEDDRIIMDLAGLASVRGGFVDTSTGHTERCDLGKDYDWSQTHVLVSSEDCVSVYCYVIV